MFTKNVHVHFSSVKSDSEGLLPECRVGLKEAQSKEVVNCVWFTISYRIAGNFDEELTLAVWRSRSKPPN